MLNNALLMAPPCGVDHSDMPVLIMIDGLGWGYVKQEVGEGKKSECFCGIGPF